VKKSCSAKSPLPSPKARTFPFEVVYKSARVTIYESVNRGEQSFAITFHSEGKRRVLTRRCFDDAYALAQDLAQKLGGGSSGAITLGGSERFVYERASEIAVSLGLPLDIALARLAEASKVLGGPELVVEACRFYDLKQRSAPPPKMVLEVVKELIDNRRANGKSELYLRDLRVRLEQRFAGAFRVPVASITTDDVEGFLKSLKGGPRTKKNFLATIGRLFSYANQRGYLPEGHPGISKVQFDAKCITEIETYTPTEMAALLNGAKPTMISSLAQATKPVIGWRSNSPISVNRYSTVGGDAGWTVRVR
jgi:hypothetical protein